MTKVNLIGMFDSVRNSGFVSARISRGGRNVYIAAGIKMKKNEVEIIVSVSASSDEFVQEHGKIQEIRRSRVTHLTEKERKKERKKEREERERKIL